MTQEMKQVEMEEEKPLLDIKELARYLLDRWFYLFLATAIAAMIAFTYTVQRIPPLYSSSASMYVNNGSVSFGGTSVRVNGSDLMTARTLVDTYTVILRDRETLEEIIEKADLPYSVGSLNAMIGAAAVNNTEVLRVTVTCADPLEAAKIANTILEVLPNRISQIVDGSAVSRISGAIPNTTPVSPNVSSRTMRGALVGLVLSVGLFTLLFLLDTQIHSEDYLVETYANVPILSAVPKMEGAGVDTMAKNGKKKRKSLREKQLLWGGMDFASTEAFNLLRTNLVLSFPEEDSGARVIGLTSTEHAEGKSLTAINMAAALAKGGHKTLLLEGDLRLPVIGKYLGLEKSAGISDFLTGMAEIKDIVHRGVGFPSMDVILCGQIPPNPSELLSSKRMAGVLNGLREIYDYIIFDLPPVGAVSDPLALLPFLTGMTVVVRHDVTAKPDLAQTMRQLKSNSVKILGFVYNGVDTSSRKYYKKYYKSKYYYSR